MNLACLYSDHYIWCQEFWLRRRHSACNGDPACGSRGRPAARRGL